MQYGLSSPPNLRIDTAPPNSGQRTTQYRRTGLPMVVLICKDLTFCQFFLSRETRKLMPEQRVAIRQQSQNKVTYRNVLIMTFASTWSSVICTWPTATPKQRTFLSWNLIVERTSVSLLPKSSEFEIGVGNFPANEKFRCMRVQTKERKRVYPSTDPDREDEESA